MIAVKINDEPKEDSWNHEKREALAWKIYEELIKSISGKPYLDEAEMVLDRVNDIIHARAVLT